MLEQQVASNASRLRLLQNAESNLLFTLMCLGTFTWALITNVAPMLVVLRGSLRKSEQLGMLGVYFLVLLFTFYINKQAYAIKFLGLGQEPNLQQLFLKQFWQPLLWG